MEKGQANVLLIIVLVIIAIALIFLTVNSFNKNPGVIGNTIIDTQQSASRNQQIQSDNGGVIKCLDKCSQIGTICVGNDIYSCYDNNGDGCKENVLVNSCGGSEECINGECKIKEYCGDEICQSDETCSSCEYDCGKCFNKYDEVVLSMLSCIKSCPSDWFAVNGECIGGCADILEKKYQTEYITEEEMMRYTSNEVLFKYNCVMSCKGFYKCTQDCLR